MTLEELLNLIRALAESAEKMDHQFPDSGDHWWKSQASLCKILLDHATGSDNAALKSATGIRPPAGMDLEV